MFPKEISLNKFGYIFVFTDSSLWAGLVIELRCPYVCMRVCNCGIFFVFFHKIEWVCMVLRILNLEGHQNYMIISKVTTIFTTFFVHA